MLIVGSIAIDTIKTQTEEQADLLGGSASYASVSASFFDPVNLVGIVGSDFPRTHIDLFRSRRIDLAGLEIADGRTFRWTGEYEADMNKRRTLHVELNVFETFSPKLPAGYRETPVVLLGNISPTLQANVLHQTRDPQFVIADTMDLWITTMRSELLELLSQVDLLVLNDSEARQLTEHDNLMKAAKTILDLGPKYVVIKKGEHGSLLISRDEFFSCAAFPLEDLIDPTGAGDAFAGGLAGYLAGLKQSRFSFEDLRKGVVRGSVVASYSVESFSLDRLLRLSPKDIEDRYDAFRRITHFEIVEK